MKIEGLSFPEAVERLAREPAWRCRAPRRTSASGASVPPPCRTWSRRRRAGSSSSSALPAGAAGLEYLRRRGLRDARSTTSARLRAGRRARACAAALTARGLPRHAGRGRACSSSPRTGGRALRSLPRPGDVPDRRPARAASSPSAAASMGDGRAEVPQLARRRRSSTRAPTSIASTRARPRRRPRTGR